MNGRLATVSIARNTLYNLLGLGLPLLVAVFAFPVIIRTLGTERFGVLSLAWMVIGYFSLFDLGLSRALTNKVSESIGQGRESHVPGLVLEALCLMLILGAAGAVVLMLLSKWLVYDVLSLSAVLREETLGALYVMAFSIPVAISSNGLRGVLEAYQMFGLTNAVKVFMGTLTFLSPVLVSFITTDLFYMVLALFAGRIVVWLTYLVFCVKTVPGMGKRTTALNGASMRSLISFGGWMTVTNIVGPLMVYMDRFLIGAMLSVAYVAYYTTPYEIVIRLIIIPSAIASVLFPAFSSNFFRDRERMESLFYKGVKYVLIAMFPCVLALATFSYEGIDFWLGHEFAARSPVVLQWLAAGVFLNGLAQIPFALVQGCGRPDLTAKLHLVELPIYLVSIWILASRYGIVGIAIAWVLRAAIDSFLLFALSRRFLSGDMRQFLRISALVGAALAAMVAGVSLEGFVAKCFFMVAALFIFLTMAWFLLLDVTERTAIHRYVKIYSIFVLKT